jgi:hypothetical protein
MPNGTLLGIPLPTALTLPDVQRQRLGTQLLRGQIAALPAVTQLRQAQALLALEKAGQFAAGIPQKFAPGAAGQIQGEKVLEREFGIDSPEAKKARLWNETSNFLKSARGRYFLANLRFKNMPTAQKQQLILEVQKETGKPIAEIEQELSGNIPLDEPSTNQGISPLSNTVDNPGSQAAAIHNTYFPTDQEKQANIQQIDQTETLLGKQTGNVAAQQALPPLLDIAKTINAIDFKPVAHFAGLHGKAYASMERGIAALGGKVSPEFEAYDNFVKSQGKLLADATRQALQTSVRNQYVMNMLMPLTNTSVWYENPELAMNRFNFFRNWINDRMKMYHYLGTKGISPNFDELSKNLGIGTPPQQTMQGEHSTITTKDLLKIARGQEDAS